MTERAGIMRSSAVAAEPRIAGLSEANWLRIGVTALIAFGFVLPFIVTKYESFQLTLAMIYAVALIGLNILTRL